MVKKKKKKMLQQQLKTNKQIQYCFMVEKNILFD